MYDWTRCAFEKTIPLLSEHHGRLGHRGCMRTGTLESNFQVRPKTEDLMRSLAHSNSSITLQKQMKIRRLVKNARDKHHYQTALLL